jgi:predicted nucleic acid-binding protein
VKAELAHADAPDTVRAWISEPPSWLEVVNLKHPVESDLLHLDAGEREAISLASELQAGLLLMDERDGVSLARRRGLKVVGTLAALDFAALRGLIDLRMMFDRLHETSFRSPLRLMTSMLEQDAERRKRKQGPKPSGEGR